MYNRIATEQSGKKRFEAVNSGSKRYKADKFSDFIALYLVFKSSHDCSNLRKIQINRFIGCNAFYVIADYLIQSVTFKRKAGALYIKRHTTF